MIHLLFYYTGAAFWVLTWSLAIIFSGPAINLAHKTIRKKYNWYYWICSSIYHPWGVRNLKKRLLSSKHAELVGVFGMNKLVEFRGAGYWFGRIYTRMIEDAILLTAPKKKI